MNVVSNLKSAEEIVIKEKTVLKSLLPINFLLSLLIVFHHGFTRNVGYIGSYNPFEYGVITGIERYLYNISNVLCLCSTSSLLICFIELLTEQ